MNPIFTIKYLKEPKKIAAGLASIERGDVVDGEVVMARLKEKLRKARESQG